MKKILNLSITSTENGFIVNWHDQSRNSSQGFAYQKQWVAQDFDELGKLIEKLATDFESNGML